MQRILMFGLTTLFLLAGSHVYAGSLEVSGYANIWVPLTHSTAANELKTSVASEVDFAKTDGKTTVRVDVDLSKVDLPSSTTSVSIEQAKVVRGLSDSMSLTAGAFNTPFGFEAQDAPNKLEFSNGQLFALRPANLAGVMWSWKGGNVGVDLLIANDFRGQANTTTANPPTTGYDNSVGAHVALTVAKVGVDVGFLTSERTKTSPAPTGNGNLMNVVLTASPMEHTDLAFELTSDDNNDGWGLTAHHAHGIHGITGRYDSVDTTGGNTATSLTVALSCAMWESVTTNLEWRTNDPGGDAASTDHIVLQWVAPF